jgi:hypothetical protein
MPHFRLHNTHRAHECRIVFAAWMGVTSPLRQQTAVSSCPMGGHEIWWDVAAGSAEEALGQLPHYVAERTTAIQISDVEIP